MDFSQPPQSLVSINDNLRDTTCVVLRYSRKGAPGISYGRSEPSSASWYAVTKEMDAGEASAATHDRRLFGRLKCLIGTGADECPGETSVVPSKT